MKDSIILFFHGYGSSVDTDKFTDIIFTNKVAVPIDYDLGLGEALSVARDAVEDLIEQGYEDIILVGHSMGGYVANAMSAEYGYNAVLICPSVKPSLNIPEICDIPTPFFQSYADIIMLIERDDEVIDYRVVQDTVADRANYDDQYFDGGHHRISRIPEITAAIQDVGNFKYPVLC